MTNTPFAPQKASRSLNRAGLVRPVLALAALGLMVTWSACKTKTDEPPPPLATAPAAVEEAPKPALTLKEEVDAAPPVELDAGSDAADASDAAKKVVGNVQSLAKCCAALRQNAASAPPPNNMYMLTAAGLCQGLQSADRTSALAQIRQALRGANLPSSCM